MAEQEPSITFTSVPDGQQAGQQYEIAVAGNTGVDDATVDLDVEVEIQIFVGRDRAAREIIDGFIQDETVEFSTTYEFTEATDHELRVLFEVDYYGQPTYSKYSDERSVEYERAIQITPQLFTAGDSTDDNFAEDVDTESPNQPLSKSFTDSLPFSIEVPDNEGSETGPTPDEILFEYSNPSIDISTGSNFVTHDIIGGATVRQRIGDKPLDISISGICTENTARKLELLRNAKKVTLLSDRFSQSSITCHVGSLSTSPLEDGGAADLKSGNFLYTYSLNCVEILDTGDNPDDLTELTE